MRDLVVEFRQATNVGFGSLADLQQSNSAMSALGGEADAHAGRKPLFCGAARSRFNVGPFDESPLISGLHIRFAVLESIPERTRVKSAYVGMSLVPAGRSGQVINVVYQGAYGLEEPDWLIPG